MSALERLSPHRSEKARPCHPTDAHALGCASFTRHSAAGDVAEAQQRCSDRHLDTRYIGQRKKRRQSEAKIFHEIAVPQRVRTLDPPVGFAGGYRRSTFIVPAR